MAEEHPNTKPEQQLAGIGSETHEVIPGLREAIIADDDPLLNEAKLPLEGPDRTDLTEFFPEDILEDDPMYSEQQFEADPELEDQLTLHSGIAAGSEDWDEEEPIDPIDPPKIDLKTTRN